MSQAEEPEPEGSRDLILLTVFVLVQHRQYARAAVLLEALYCAGDFSPEVLLGRAVVRFLSEEWLMASTCLDELDRADPIERFGRYELDERQRLRRFMKARCLFELGNTQAAREAVNGYLRDLSQAGPPVPATLLLSTDV